MVAHFKDVTERQVHEQTDQMGDGVTRNQFPGGADWVLIEFDN